MEVERPDAASSRAAEIDAIACGGGVPALAEAHGYVAEDDGQNYHSQLAEADAAADPLVRYKILATESNEILFLAADVVAAALADGAAAAAFLPFTRVPWDRVVADAAALRGDDARDGALLGEALRRLCGDAAPLLRDALAARLERENVQLARAVAAKSAALAERCAPSPCGAALGAARQKANAHRRRDAPQVLVERRSSQSCAKH